MADSWEPELPAGGRLTCSSVQETEVDDDRFFSLRHGMILSERDGEKRCHEGENIKKILVKLSPAFCDRGISMPR